MKTIILRRWFALIPLTLTLILFVPVASTFITGCAIERTVEAKKFDTFKSVYSVAREAYKTFKRQCFNGQVTAANEAKGDKAWNEFRDAYSAVFKAGMDSDAAPDQIVILKNQLVRLLLTL